MIRSTTLLVALASASCLACGATQSAPSRGDLPSVIPRPKQAKVPAGQLPLAGHRFAEVRDAIGPYVGSDGQASLAVWADAVGGAGGRSLFAMPISAQGVPEKPLRIGPVAGDLDLVLVRPFAAAQASSPGAPRFAIVTTRRDGAKTRIDVTATGADGRALWGPTTIAERAPRVLWVGFVAGSRPLLLWAEPGDPTKAGEAAALYGLGLDAERGSASEPTLVASRACAWQVAVVQGRAALASVRPSGGDCSAGAVQLDLLGATAKPEKTIELGGRAELDLDLVATPAGFLLAWSDRLGLEPRVLTALIDSAGAIVAPAAAAVPAVGEQAVIGLAAGGSARSPGFLVWENVSQRPEGARVFELSALDAQARAAGTGSRLLYARADGSVPELSAFQGGIAALTLAPMCPIADDCADAPPVPTFVSLDAALNVTGSEPLVLEGLGGRAADLGWGLTCGATSCFSLAAPSKSPASLFSVPLPRRASAYHPAAERARAAARPRVVSSEVLADASEALAHVTLGDYAGRTLLGYVTDFDPTTPWQKLTRPAADGRLEPLRAKVALRAFEREGARRPLAEEQPISLRAHSLGGLTLVSEGPSAKEALALWTGLDKGEPQVFLTLVDGSGKRSQQKMLTHKPGDASDVAGLALESGYLVAWVDERSGDSEVYAARVTRALERAGPEQRITTSDGGAAEIALTRIGGKPFAVWADARAAEQPGWADLYGAFLRPADAARDGEERRLTSTRPHSFSPRLAELSGAPVLAWLEEGSETAPPSVRVAGISPTGELLGNVSVVELERAVPHGLGMECGAERCRIVVSVDSDGRGELHGFEWRPGASASPQASRIVTLGSASASGVAPVVRGNFVYAVDQRDGRGLVRRLGIEW